LRPPIASAVEVVRVLGELGANLNLAIPYSVATPAYIARHNGNVEVVRLLNFFGASTPLSAAMNDSVNDLLRAA
jgi:hypothetical protein